MFGIFKKHTLSPQERYARIEQSCREDRVEFESEYFSGESILHRKIRKLSVRGDFEPKNLEKLELYMSEKNISEDDIKKWQAMIGI